MRPSIVSTATIAERLMCDRRNWNDAMPLIPALHVSEAQASVNLGRSRVSGDSSFSEVGMASVGLGRRAFVEALVAVPFGSVALSAQTSSPPVVKVAAGSGRANDIIKLPGG